MGRKPTRTEEDKKQYNAEYYQKYKQEHNRAYQLSARKTYFKNMILTLTEKLKDPNLTQELSNDSTAKQRFADKISKFTTRIENYRTKLQEIEEELKIVREPIWESDYHKNAEYKLTYYGHYHPLRGFRGSYNIVSANNIMCKTR